MSRSLAVRVTLLVLSALVPVSGARGATQSRARVTIRGTGSSVVIERSEGPVRKRLSEATAVPAPAGPLAEAVHQKSQGASDTAVISYLRAHEAELPPVVASEDVKQLRKAGAGKGVVAYLATVAAVDIGETGEGYETAVSAAPGSPIDMETAPYGMSAASADTERPTRRASSPAGSHACAGCYCLPAVPLSTGPSPCAPRSRATP